MSPEGIIGAILFIGVVVAIVFGREYVRKRADQERASREAARTRPPHEQ